MIKADKEADGTWRTIILRSRQMVLLRGVMTTVIILTSRSMLGHGILIHRSPSLLCRGEGGGRGI